MDAPELRRLLVAHLDTLVSRIGPRPPGSPANRQATDYARSVLLEAGLPVRALPFSTSWWEPGDGNLELADGTVIEVEPNPFSRTGRAEGEVVWLGCQDDLSRRDESLRGKVVVLHPTLGGQPVMPKGFPFAMPDRDRQLIEFLEHHAPSAVIAVSDRHASLPTFEDPDLTVPTVTVAPVTAVQLRPGDRVRLELEGTSRSGAGVNLSARVGTSASRIVVSAHVDTKVTTPGTFDNAASVAVLLALAETLWDELDGTELVFFNGEDHHDACGEQAWLAATDLREVYANINLDGTGVAGRRTGVACMACPPALEQLIERQLRVSTGWVRMPPWFESDHAIFAMQGIPAVAITSENVHELFTSVAHTAADTLDVVDVDILVDIVEVLRDLLPRIVSLLVPERSAGTRSVGQEKVRA